MRRHVNLPEHEADDAKRNGNPGLSVHKEIGGGYSQTNPSTWDVAFALIDGGHRIIPLPAPRLATRNPFHAQPASAQEAMSFDCLKKIDRAGRMETAPGGRPAEPCKKRRKRPLIGTDANSKQQDHRQGRRIEARLPRRNHSSSNSW